MMQFNHALQAWQTDRFQETLKRELLAIRPSDLPLHRGADHGGFIDDSRLEATVLGFSADATAIRARVGVFFTEIVAGCSCGDEPMPTNAYCELEIRIDKQSAETEITAAAD